MSALRESSGLIVLAVLFAALVGGRRLYTAVLHRRLIAAAERPLPGRTRDVAWDIDITDQPIETPGQILSRPPRPYRPLPIPDLPMQRSRAS